MFCNVPILSLSLFNLVFGGAHPHSQFLELSFNFFIFTTCRLGLIMAILTTFHLRLETDTFQGETLIPFVTGTKC